MAENILVTGGCGSIGKKLIVVLLRNGFSVTNVDKQDGPHPGSSAYSFVHSDITASDLVERLGDQDYSTIIHLAAETKEKDSFNNVIGFHKANVSGTLGLLEYARKRGVPHFILSSSGAVRNDDGSLVRTPRSPYVATKMAAEQFAEVHARLHGASVSVLRLFSLYGEGVRSDLQGLIDSSLLNTTVQLPASAQRFHPVKVDEVVSAIVSVMDHADGFRVHELGSRVSIEDEEVSALIALSLGKELQRERSSDTKAFVDVEPHSANAVELLGIDDFSSLKEGLADLLSKRSSTSGSNT